MVYGWKVFKSGSICVQVKGFNAKGKKTWYNAGCGKSGQITVPWGNVAANKEMKVKGGSASALELRFHLTSVRSARSDLRP
ncbi:hypothetical protein ACF1BU_08720 [Streptomyces sp. NPDC014724]|uniref:hypothetical protein n=1 Tax=unclassified Streptomyces TaxID=2593676 RepID=UPI0036FCFBAF